MNINLKKKNLYLNKYKIKCAVGKRGITSKKVEGDNKTPRGTFKFKSVFYRKDRMPNLKSLLKKVIIKKNMGWCNDLNSKFYNKLIKFPFIYKAEKLWLKNNTYDMVLILNYNFKPIIKKKGSAIFLHVAKKNYRSTLGCLAISKKDMLFLITRINKRTKLIIN